MDSNVKVSVIVPVYNVETYLEECLESIINQTLEEIEIICVNDGSTDSSLKILEKYAKKDKRIKIITQVNGGLSAARNTGMKYITGEYTSFIDSDDWIDTNTYEILYDFAKSKDLDILMFLLMFFNQKTSETYQTQYSSLEVIDNSLDKTIFTYKDVSDVLFKIAHSPCNKLYKSSYLKDINLKFEDGLNYEDIPFFFPSFIKAKKISIIRKPLYYYRIRDESISTNGDEGSYDIFKVLNIFLNYMKEENLFHTLKQEILMYLIVNIKFVYLRLNKKYRNEYFKLICENYEKFSLDKVDLNYLEKWHFDDKVFYLAISNSENSREFHLNYKKEYYKFLYNHHNQMCLDLDKENQRLLNENIALKKNSYLNKIKNFLK